MEKMDRGQEASNFTLTLPMELLVAIASWLTIRDRVKLRCVSRRLRSAGEAPSLWREFVWDYYDLREELYVSKILKVYGEHIRRLAFPGYLSPQLELLKYCSNVKHLSLPVVLTVNPDQLGEVVRCMEQLLTLDIYWDTDAHVKPLLLVGSKLRELTLYVSKNCGSESFVDSVNDWVCMGFKPPKLNIVFTATNYLAQMNHESVENWQQWNSKVPVGKAAYLKVYTGLKIPLKLFPVQPIFQLYFGQTAVIPLVHAKQCGISGLSLNYLQLTDCSSGSKTLYKATGSALLCPSNNSITNLHFLTHFEIYTCSSFLPADLEQLAMVCPNLQRLKLSTCRQVLESLQGLRAIANHCQDLQGLSIMGISVTQLESQIQLWEILSTLKLTHLTADFCILSPYVSGVEYEGMMISLYKKCSSLLALESLCMVYGCRRCLSSVNKDWLILRHFPSLKYCNLFNCYSRSTAIHSMITNFKKLTCLRIHNSAFSSPLSLSSAPNYNLEQLYIVSTNSDIPDIFMSSVSAHGGLVHVFLSVYAASVVGVSELIENSPKLVTFHCLLERTFDEYGILPEEEFTEFECTLRQKFQHRKLFNVGGYRLLQRNKHNQHSLNSPYLRQTDLNSL